MFMKPASLATALLVAATTPADLSRDIAGAPVHARPGAVVYGGTDASPDLVLFSQSSDGYVRAVNGSTGEEIWAILPEELSQELPAPTFNPDPACEHRGSAADIVPVVADRDGDGTIEPGDADFVHLVFGLQRGGNSIYSIDVTDRFNPVLNWRFASPSLGQSWSRPTIARIDIAPRHFSAMNTDRAVVVVGGGYDSVHDTLSHPSTPDVFGAGIYMLDLHSGAVIWRAGPDGAAELTLDPGSKPGLARSIPNQVRVIDMNSDGFADRMYASDTGGQILRFDIFNGGEPKGIGPDAMVTGGVIAQLGAEGMAAPADQDARRFYTTPDVSVFYDTLQSRRFVAISIGSGYRPNRKDNTPVERFFSLRDADVFRQLTQAEYDAYPIVSVADLVEVSGATGAAVDEGRRGWMLTLPPDQKVLSSSGTFDNEIYFVAFEPETAATSNCFSATGRNFLYRVSVVNGDPTVDGLDDVVSSAGDEPRMSKLRQVGIAPPPSFLFQSPRDPNCTGAGCTAPPLACIGVECFETGFVNRPVRTVWTQNGTE